MVCTVIFTIQSKFSQIFLLATMILGATVAPAFAQDNYRLGPEDTLTVQVLDVSEIPDRPVKVDKNGYIDVPMIGRLEAAGKTAPELESAWRSGSRKFVRNPKVSVHVIEYHSSPVSVLGEVNTPGVYQLSGPKHLLELISMAGGLRADAGSTVQITREVAAGPLDLPTARLDVTGKYRSVEVDLTSLRHRVRIRH